MTNDKPLSAMEQDRRARQRAYSIVQWCELRGVSRAMFYKLLAQGRAPATYRVGARRFVSEEADAMWQAAMEAETAAEQAA